MKAMSGITHPQKMEPIDMMAQLTMRQGLILCCAGVFAAEVIVADNCEAFSDGVANYGLGDAFPS